MAEHLTRLKFLNDDIRHVAALAAHHLRFKDGTRMRTSALKRSLRMDRFEEHLELLRLDSVSSHRMLDHYYFVKSKLEEFSTEQLEPTPLLTGHDLIAAGYEPGPVFTRILKAVEDAQLEGEIGTPEQALRLVRSRFEVPEGN
jgi:poly(A) polymerase